jgi:glucose/arabinose dehydrogenase
MRFFPAIGTGTVLERVIAEKLSNRQDYLMNQATNPHLHYARTGLLSLLLVGLSACGDTANLPLEAGIGPNPQLPPPNESLIPTVNVADATGWPDDATPVSASGLAVNAYAGGLDHPRWLYVLPNGDVLVAETNAPPREQDGNGIKGWIMGLMMKKAGAGVPSANRITLLRDSDNDGVAETVKPFLQGLNSPFGMALIGNNLYVANTDAIVRFPYQEGTTETGAASLFSR